MNLRLRARLFILLLAILLVGCSSSQGDKQAATDTPEKQDGHPPAPPDKDKEPIKETAKDKRSKAEQTLVFPDPLSDLASLLVYWTEPGESEMMGGLRAVTSEPGFPSREQLVEMLQALVKRGFH